jgi:abortive infection bacteriophage resistance protein
MENNMHKKAIKPFVTYSDQINILTQKKQLNISDLSYAEEKLHDIGYYSLIDGYKNIFYNPMTRTYEHGTNFSDIVALYEFDENLRSLVFKYICHVEQKIRSLISYSFCETFSENQAAYLNSNNYNISSKNSRDISKLISILTYEANQNMEHNYVVYQRNTYGNVPLWVIMKTLTLGQTSKMYSFMLPSIKSKVSVHYGNITEKELIQYLKVLTVFRNICAHNERLFSFETRFEIPDTILHKKMNIPQKGTQYLYGKHDMFALLIAFRYLLNKKDFKSLKKELSKLFNTFSTATSVAQKSKLLQAMHFPSNWMNITRYKFK